MNRPALGEDQTNLEICFLLNGTKTRLSIKPWETALEVLRNQSGLTGVKEGCGIGECGACTIILDGKAVNSCLMLAAQLDGRKVETVEGLTLNGKMHFIQRAFLEKGAVQCGFCTPGMLMSAKALLDKVENPSTGKIVEALTGNLCRCAGYVQILEAVNEAALMKTSVSEEDVTSS
jgi:aerobic carbon-monoxide dehydrogenase small subunit